MMLLYNIGIRLYLLFITIASLFNQKARLWLRGRKGWKENIKNRFSKTDRVFWFHCASLGEFEQGRPLIEMIKIRDPSIKILLTFFSPSGYQVRKDYGMADYVMYLPADTRNNARLFVNLVKPDAAIFIKYEFWYNYLETLREASIPSYLVSGIFRKDQLFFRWYGLRFLKVVKGFTKLFVQDGDSEKLLRAYGVERVILSGDTRFDRVFDIAKKSDKLEILESFCPTRDAIIAGSTWPAEEDIICRYINESTDRTRWIIAPHEIDDDHIASIERKLRVKSIRYSEASESDPSDFDVLIIDNIGLLSSAYRYGKLAVIGGGFGRGIHNVLEPASWGLPVLFGPNHLKFREAVDLLSSGGAFTFSDNTQFTDILERLLEKNDALGEASKCAEWYVKSNLGATVNVIDNIL